MPSELSELLSERLWMVGAEPALAFEGHWRSWSWLAHVACAIDTALTDAGIGQGQPIGLIARNRPAHVAAMAALISTRRTTCMIYSAQSPAAMAAEVKGLSAPALLADPQDWTDEVRAAAEAIGALGLAISADTAQRVEVVTPPSRSPGAHKPPAPDVAFEFLSSGTTGAPKRLPLTWVTVNAVVDGAATTYAGSGRRDAPLVMIHPLGNIAGMAYLAPALAYGQPMVLLERFTVEDWTRAVREHRPVRAALPPAAVQMLLDAHASREDLSSLNLIAVGGARIAPELQEAFEAAYGVPILTAFGATEFGGVIAHWSLEEYRRVGASKRGSAGRASAGAALRIVDPETFTALGAGAVGLLEAQVDRIGPDWIRTNDLASLDADGFLYLHGRADAAINRGGFKVVPEVVSTALRTHPAVADAVVIGLPDARLGEVPAAAVELRKGIDAPSPDALKTWLRDRLLAYQVPVEIRIVEALPRNASMKVSMPETRRLFTPHPIPEASACG